MLPNFASIEGAVRRAASAAVCVVALAAATPALAGTYHLTVSTAKVKIGGP